jgi:hypothetical protein
MNSMKFLLLFLACVGMINMNAQCDTTVTLCEKFMPTNYVSDGQTYRAFLVNDEVAEFSTTFFAGVDYRIAVMSGTEKGELEFRLLDQERKLLFSSQDYDLTPFWNFRAESTQDCVIEAQLKKDGVGSGCAVILISFSR